MCFAQLLLQSFSLYLDGRARLREGIQSNKIEILPFRNTYVTEASFDLLCRSIEGDAGKVQMSIFLCAPRNGSDIVGRQSVGRMAAWGVVEGFKNGEEPNLFNF